MCGLACIASLLPGASRRATIGPCLKTIASCTFPGCSSGLRGEKGNWDVFQSKSPPNGVGGTGVNSFAQYIASDKTLEFLFKAEQIQDYHRGDLTPCDLSPRKLWGTSEGCFFAWGMRRCVPPAQRWSQPGPAPRRTAGTPPLRSARAPVRAPSPGLRCHPYPHIL